MARIRFGTDGWRAVIAEEFTFANVRLITQAIARYIVHDGRRRQGIVVGYDNRFLSPEFAQEVTAVFNGNGIKVYLCALTTPTPVVAYTVQKLGTAGAVMLTASHNPADYHGLKFIPYYAAPAMPEVTDKIRAILDRMKDSGPEILRMDSTEARKRGLLEYIEPRDDYLQHLARIIDTKVIQKVSPTVVVDPMHGAGIGYLETFLTALGCRVLTNRDYRDPLFGGSLPDPGEQYLQPLREKVLRNSALVGVALDGDADRLGVIDSTGEYWGANKILTLFLDHLVRSRGWNGIVARTVATTHMLDRLAQFHGVEIVETPVGFKYIGEQMRLKDAFLGGEESGGLSIRGHVPEKDGILAAALFIEMLCAAGQEPSSLLTNIYQRVGALYSGRIDISTSPETKARVIVNLREWEPKKLGSLKVREIKRIDGMKIILEGDCWCLIRASGTEPLFRIYAEAPTKEQRDRLQNAICDTLNISLFQ
ncbi:MAG: phosphoglucomutase/phosphomannomutase family protein [Dethiobacteria bacterium]